MDEGMKENRHVVPMGAVQQVGHEREVIELSCESSDNEEEGDGPEGRHEAGDGWPFGLL
ncbi:PRC domain containing protein [Sesbania bispinosa]|nr:PRC domain containing protein [Sesbania bispinosa]